MIKHIVKALVICDSEREEDFLIEVTARAFGLSDDFEGVNAALSGPNTYTVALAVCHPIVRDTRIVRVMDGDFSDDSRAKAMAELIVRFPVRLGSPIEGSLPLKMFTYVPSETAVKALKQSAVLSD